MAQQHAPPTEAEAPLDENRTKKGPRSYLRWVEPAGWCSACLEDEDDRPVVMFGTRERFVGLCNYCVDRLQKTLADTPSGSEER